MQDIRGELKITGRKRHKKKTHYIYFSFGLPIATYKQITTMPVWGPGFEVSLDFYVNSLVSGNNNGYSWIFTIREECNSSQYFSFDIFS